MTGRVYLVGAGPGDPGLLTLRGQRCLAAADVVVHDYLVGRRLLEAVRPDDYRRPQDYRRACTLRLRELRREEKLLRELRGKLRDREGA